jgi:ABC-2 type transport system permease protein
VNLATTRTLNARRAGDQPRRWLVIEVALMSWRNLVAVFRTPEAMLPPLAISLFFLVIYDSTLGRASSFIPDLGANSYLGFILPLSIISASLAGAGIAAQNLVREIESGYFDKLLLTPISRAALLLGPIFAGAVILGIQASLVMAVGLLLGLEPSTGLPGLLAVGGLAILLGTGFAGFTVSAALGSGSAAATHTFLAPTFVPLELLDGWLSTAARFNPITYVLQAMRGLMNSGWEAAALWQAVAACLILAVAMYALAAFALRVRTSRK